MLGVLKKKLNKKGFTLAELLVVVAIIGVLVAISIPIFTSQLTKARRATNQANARAAAAAAITTYLTDNGKTSGTYKVESGSYDTSGKPDALTPVDYGSRTIESFVVTISGDVATVTPQDGGPEEVATYNKAGS